MRLETHNWTVSGASKIGHAHKFSGTNRQDAYSLCVNPKLIAAYISDGCSVAGVNTDQVHTEVGANLLVRRAGIFTQFLLNKGLGANYGWSIPLIVDELFHELKSLIELNTSLMSSGDEERAFFLRDYFSATFLGVMIELEDNGDMKDGWVFRTGDGIIECHPGIPYLESNVFKIDQGNCPDYLAHACLHNPEKFGVTRDKIPRGFTRHQLPKDCTKLMIATDGFDHHNTLKLGLNKANPSLFGEQWDKKGQFGLSKWMNARQLQGYFDDDVTVVTVERTMQQFGRI